MPPRSVHAAGFLPLFLVAAGVARGPAPTVDVAPARLLTAEEATEDVRLLRRAIEDVHPGYGRYTPRADMDAAFARLEATVAHGTTDMALYLAVTRVLADLRCDHTKAELPPAIEQHRRDTATHLPFTFRLFDGRMLVDRTDPEQTGLVRGDEVLAINGVPTATIIEEVAPLVSVDGWTDETRRVEMESSSEYLGDAVDHFWPFLHGWPAAWSIIVRDHRGGPDRQLDLTPVTYDDWLELATGGAGRFVDFPDSVSFRMIDETTAYLSIGTFVNYRRPVPPATVLDPAFDEFARRGATRLIIDLRACGGGSADVPEVLRTYLADTIVPSARRPPWVRTREFGDLRPHLSTWDESVFEMPAELFTDLGNGFLELRESVGEPRPAPARANRFRGEVIALSSAANASGATILLALLQEHHGVTVIGEATGGSAEGPTAGVILFLRLPHSDITVRVPALRSWVNVRSPSPGRGVIPDVVVPLPADAWLEGRDPVLEAARR